MKNYKVIINQRVIDAINFILASNNGLTKAFLAENLGVKPAKFSEILSKRMTAGMDIIQNLCIEYRISADWLITGEGEMIKQDIVNEPLPNKDDITAAYIAAIDAQRTTIDAQRDTIIILKGKVADLEDRLDKYEGGNAHAVAG
ncbi:MAG: hypothetical protein II817_07175 [Bacteroidales bacterium]|nr:hypothetical protein [Bacteroidales bacterium]